MKFDTSIHTQKFFDDCINTQKYIMLHHTASSAPEKNQVKYLALNKKQVSCHYVIGYTGKIYQIADDNKCTWHAGKGSYEGIKNTMNNHAIGIEVCSDGYYFTDKQKEAVESLCLYLMKKYKIPGARVIRHLDYTKRKRDIGDNFWKKDFPHYAEYQKHLDSLTQENSNQGKSFYQKIYEDEIEPHLPPLQQRTFKYPKKAIKEVKTLEDMIWLFAVLVGKMDMKNINL